MRQNKFRAVPTVVDGVRFHSKGEAGRYAVLKFQQQAGQIEDLVLQPRFPILVAGLKVCTYVADFAYIEDGKQVVEDFKGMRTPTYRLKAKLFRALYPHLTFKETHA
jgi:hypothetical protein